MDPRRFSFCVYLLTFTKLVSGQLLPNSAVVTPVDNNQSPIEVEILLQRFSNPHGIVYSGKKCDFFAWGCDVRASGYLDMDKPYDEWPGQRAIQSSDFFWYRGEESSPRFSQIFRKTICNPSSFQAGNLRVNLIDVDGGLRGADDFINNFNCIFTKDASVPSSPKDSKWSREMLCDALYSNPLMAMYFQYRMYRNPSAKC